MWFAVSRTRTLKRFLGQTAVFAELDHGWRFSKYSTLLFSRTDKNNSFFSFLSLLVWYRLVCMMFVFRDLMSSSSNSKMVEWRRSQTVLMLDAPGGVFTCAFPLCLHWGPEASDCICQLYIPVWCSQATWLHCQSRLIPPLALCCRCFCCRGFFFFFSWQFALFFPFFLKDSDWPGFGSLLAAVPPLFFRYALDIARLPAFVVLDVDKVAAGKCVWTRK